MSESIATCSYIVDTHGLYEIASHSSGNVRATLFDLISKGVIGVPAIVWSEFQELYPNDAKALQSIMGPTIRFSKKAYIYRAGFIAENLNSAFSSVPYDDGVEIQVAAIASVEAKQILSSKIQVTHYQKMSCAVVCIEELLDSLSIAS